MSEEQELFLLPNFWLNNKLESLEKQDNKTMETDKKINLEEGDNNWLKYLENKVLNKSVISVVKKRRDFVQTDNSNSSSCTSESIDWADDEVEGESTELLRKLWNDIQHAFDTGCNSSMSEKVYNEIMCWRRAFPNLNEGLNDGATDTVGRILTKVVTECNNSGMEIKPNYNNVETWLSHFTPNSNSNNTIHSEENQQGLLSFNDIIKSYYSTPPPLVASDIINRKLKNQRPISSQQYLRNVPLNKYDSENSRTSREEIFTATIRRRSSVSNKLVGNNNNWSRYTTTTTTGNYFYNEDDEDIIISDQNTEKEKVCNGVSDVKQSQFLKWLLFDTNTGQKRSQ